MKQITGKVKFKNNNFPKRLLINNKETCDEENIANEFNQYFVDVGSKLAENIPSSTKHYSSYMTKSNTILIDNSSLTIKEFENAFKTLKLNKACGFDDINPNLVKSSYGELMSPLFHICKISLEKSIFPDKMKIAKIVPLFKSGETNLTKNLLRRFWRIRNLI